MSAFLLIISLVLIVGGIWLILTTKKVTVSDDIVHVGMIGWYLTAAAKIMGAPKRVKELSSTSKKITGAVFIIAGVTIAFSYIKTCGFPIISAVCNY